MNNNGKEKLSVGVTLDSMNNNVFNQRAKQLTDLLSVITMYNDQKNLRVVHSTPFTEDEIKSIKAQLFLELGVNLDRQ